ncbi:MAG: precorrin-8X methylmutase [Alphaproteobacteria bacterium GM202ARS2]|nr:precorrin-8X methylmutase [Alphaproteobacteria bacterium GM202ARS2]
MTAYVKSPVAIDSLSHRRLHRHVPSDLSPEWQHVTIRLMQACGMTDIIDDLRWHESFVSAARTALNKQCLLLTDSQMVACGINRDRLHPKRVISLIGSPEAYRLAETHKTTRAAALVDVWQQQYPWHNQLIAIGNAPTCLFRLLDVLAESPPQHDPAAIIAFPVGFVGAARAKQQLHDTLGTRIPYLTLLGTRGGSALTVATIHALLSLSASS